MRRRVLLASLVFALFGLTTLAVGQVAAARASGGNNCMITCTATWDRCSCYSESGDCNCYCDPHAVCEFRPWEPEG